MSQQACETAAIADELTELAAHVHAAQAQLAGLAAEADRTEAWCGDGYRSCAHWLTVTTGLDYHTACELLRVGHALTELPLLRDAALAGSVSFDKLRVVTHVATGEDDDVWLNMAVSASGAQLTRICRAYRRSGDDDQDASVRRARRGVWARWTDDGMLDLRALLSAEDGGVVLAALDAVARRDAAERASAPASDNAEAKDPQAASRADALVGIAESVVGANDRVGAGASSASHRLVVHVDATTLLGDDLRGRSHVEDGSGLPASVIRRLGCDTEVVAVLERNGAPIGVGRARRTISGRLRRALQMRDRHCRYPGCGVPAARTHGHHIRHWADQGRTDLDNLVSLCGFHHRRIHDGAFSVTAGAGGERRFLTASGRLIGGTQVAPVAVAGSRDLRQLLETTEPITATTAMARDAGSRVDMSYVIEVLRYICDGRRDRGSPPPSAGSPERNGPT
jgi:hypothetical protein